jgi:hypothetical protein
MMGGAHTQGEGIAVWLTSHLEAKGNELDIFITQDAKPLAITASTVSLVVITRARPSPQAAVSEYKLTFEPAPDDERPAVNEFLFCFVFFSFIHIYLPGVGRG